MRRLEIPDNHAAAAAAIHVLEHFYEWEAAPLLSEWMRVLRPGGELILELPCMDKVLHYIARCLQQNAPIVPAFSWYAFWGSPKEKSVPMTHKWGYTQQMLLELLESVGFVEITFETPRYHFAERDMRCVSKKP